MDRQDIFTAAAIASLVASLIKVWEFVSPWFAQTKVQLYKTRIKKMLAWTATSPPVDSSIVPGCGAIRLNVFDADNMGLNHGYTALRFRQNVSPYYYTEPKPPSKVFELA
jgi:hypothetical protein